MRRARAALQGRRAKESVQRLARKKAWRYWQEQNCDFKAQYVLRSTKAQRVRRQNGQFASARDDDDEVDDNMTLQEFVQRGSREKCAQTH
eukprot:5004205-Lingulodinium_polyedra.AAC.1